MPATLSGRCFDVRLARAGLKYSTVPNVGGRRYVYSPTPLSHCPS